MLNAAWLKRIRAEVTLHPALERAANLHPTKLTREDFHVCGLQLERAHEDEEWWYSPRHDRRVRVRYAPGEVQWLRRAADFDDTGREVFTWITDGPVVLCTCADDIQRFLNPSTSTATTDTPSRGVRRWRLP